MKLTGIPFEERLKQMRSRYDLLTMIAEEISTFKDFIDNFDDLLADYGIETTMKDEYIVIHFQLDSSEYEDYYVIPDKESDTLTVSDVIAWQDDMCCNSYLNIFYGTPANAKDIL